MDADGNVLDLNVSVSSVYDNAGNVTGYSSISLDISEAKWFQQQLENKVAEQTAVIKEVFERVKDVFVATDAQLNIIYANKNVSYLFDAGVTDILGKNLLHVLADVIDVAELNLVKASFKGLLFKDFEFYNDRVKKWFHADLHPSENGLSLYFKDVTENKATADALSKSKRLYKFISDTNELILNAQSANEIFWKVCQIAVHSGNYLFSWIGIADAATGAVNPVASAGNEAGYLKVIGEVSTKNIITGRGPSGRAMREGKSYYCNDIENDEAMAPWRKEALARGYRSSIAIPIVQSGKVIACFTLYAGKAFYFNEEEIQLLQRVVENVGYALTKRADQEALLKSEANLKSIFDSTQICYLLVDAGLKVRSYNDHYLKFYTEFIGRTLRPDADIIELMLPERRADIEAMFKKVLTTGNPVEYEAAYKGDRTPVYYYVTVNPVVNNDQNIGLCIALTDITAKKGIEIERQKMIDDLMQRNSTLHQFSYIISHNVRGPVSTILGLNNLLQEAKDEDTFDAVMKGIETTTEQLDTVIKDLNDILNVRENLAEVKVNIKLSELIGEIETGMMHVIAEQKVTIDTDFRAINEFSAVRSYMYSIFYNLITNSIKYVKKDVPAYINIKSETDGRNIILLYKDNGIGIDMDRHKDKVFKLYNRFDLSVEGRGLGLYMTKTQIELLNGSIRIESQPGVGTKFTITLPL
jgi:signal transduction histidine kinase/putative methionine-R-sulfoxide reductase with GAF domain